MKASATRLETNVIPALAIDIEKTSGLITNTAPKSWSIGCQKSSKAHPKSKKSTMLQ